MNPSQRQAVVDVDKTVSWAREACRIEEDEGCLGSKVGREVGSIVKPTFIGSLSRVSPTQC